MRCDASPNPDRIYGFDVKWGILDVFAVDFNDAHKYVLRHNGKGCKFVGNGPHKTTFAATTEERSKEIRRKNIIFDRGIMLYSCENGECTQEWLDLDAALDWFDKKEREEKEYQKWLNSPA